MRYEPDEVLASSTPGLVVHRRDFVGVRLGPAWLVVHEDSGIPLRGLVVGATGPVPVVLEYGDPATAVRVADALVGLADWDVPALEVEAARVEDRGALLYEVGTRAAEAAA